MAHNPILEEIYAARDKLLADCKGNIHAYVRAARQRVLDSGRPIAVPQQPTGQSSDGGPRVLKAEDHSSAAP